MSYLGIAANQDIVINSKEYTATANQTVFDVTYDNYVEVSLNGTELSKTDYTATDGMTVVLATGANAGDIVQLKGFESFKYNNSVMTNTNQTISGVKTFTDNPVIPNAIGDNEPLSKGQLLTEIKAVDGAGSGLDTDKVRGDYINPNGMKNIMTNGSLAVWQMGENALYGTPPAWAASTAYAVDDIIIPSTANGYYYICTVAGTSNSAEPVWTTGIGDAITDNTVTWECKGLQGTVGYLSADMVFSYNASDGQYIITKSELNGSNSIKFTVNEVVTDLSASKYWNTFRTIFEGQDLYTLAKQGKTVTLSFWFNSNVIGIYPIAFRNSTNNSYVNTYVTTFNYTTANVPQKIEVQIPLNYAFNPALLNDNNRGLDFMIGWLNQGDYATSTTEAWQSGIYLTTPDCVNWGATKGNFFEIAEIQLEEGEVATPFEHRPYALELSLCQRYYEVGVASFYNNKDAATRGSAGTEIVFNVSKRVTPSMSKTTGTAVVGSGALLGYQNVSGVYITDDGATAAINRELNFNWKADARL